jgi:hypothetical protein
MYAMKYETPSKANIQRRGLNLQVGDRVITNNSRLGTIIRMAKDSQGEYLIVQLDILPGEFAYDVSDLEKILK